MRRLPLALLLVAQSGGLPAESSVVPSEVASFAGYSEGIVFDAAGNAYVSLLRRNEVLRLRLGAPSETWARLVEPNGHKILSDGSHVVAAKVGIVHLRPDGSPIDTIATAFAGVALQGPNDIALDGNGGFYFSDPAATDSAAAARRGRVYHVDARRTLRLAAADFCYPNGLLVRRDGRVLYVDDSCTSHVYAFDIVSPGTLVRRRVFASLPDSGQAFLDGMTSDERGNLYIAHYRANRVEVLDSTGALVRRYNSLNLLSSNVAFGGANLDELFVTGAPGTETGPGMLTRLRLPGVSGRSSRAVPAVIR